MRKQQIYGVIALGIMGFMTLIAIIVMFRASWMLGGIYLLGCIGAGGGILYAFCAKCPCKDHCGHVFPGKLARAFPRKPGPYTKTELVVVALGLFLMIGLPQFWLWRYPGLLIAFWGLLAITFVPMQTVVCPTCENQYCPLKPR